MIVVTDSFEHLSEGPMAGKVPSVYRRISMRNAQRNAKTGNSTIFSSFFLPKFRARSAFFLPLRTIPGWPPEKLGWGEGF